MINIEKKLKIFLASLVPLVAISLLCEFYRDKIELVNIAMLYLLPIIYVATKQERFITFIISLIAVLLFDILCIDPIYHLNIYNYEYLLSFLIIIFVGQFICVLSQKATRAKELEASEILYETVFNSISHELRTPLTVILGSTSSLISNEIKLTQPEKDEMCQDAYNSALEMKEIIENLLTRARIESGIIKPNLEHCFLSEIVYSALQKIEKKYNKQANYIVYDEMIKINSDYAILELALLNIIDNAFKYGFNIGISIQIIANNAVVEIRNDGLIPKDYELENLGSKFARLSNAHNINGVGIGYYVSKKLLESLNIDMKSYIDDGFFVVEIEIRKI
ncbi:MAG: hypothetical protein RL154_1429 [Pseudomonadota bacterium]|jgi:two-component system sensor histidine kinase KdpD